MIRILTQFYKTLNFGGMLQSYAMCAFLQKQHHVAEQIAFAHSMVHLNLYSRIKSVGIKALFYRVSIKIISLILRTRMRKRVIKFSAFADQYVPYNHNVYNARDVFHSISQSDIAIVGSDQVWNPSGTEDAYFLDFVPDNNGKIAYAASIGANEVSQDFLNHVEPYLRRFDFISVREESAKEILQPHLEQEIKVVLDPTLLLSRGEWDKIAVQPTIPQPYIFVYLLGEKRAHRRLIKKFARTLGLKIALLPHVHFRFNPADCFFADYNLYDVGPAEFVGLIKNAEMVITDSFHGCVFSIIYRRKFWALKRHKDSDPKNMNSRLYTLFDSLELKNRLIEDENTTYDADILNMPIDYAMVEAKLSPLRKESVDFLLNAIKAVQARMEKENKDSTKENG